jgi:hypothetical protein
MKDYQIFAISMLVGFCMPPLIYILWIIFYEKYKYRKGIKRLQKRGVLPMDLSELGKNPVTAGMRGYCPQILHDFSPHETTNPLTPNP